jgi:hypothetical protein
MTRATASAPKIQETASPSGSRASWAFHCPTGSARSVNTPRTVARPARRLGDGQGPIMGLETILRATDSARRHREPAAAPDGGEGWRGARSAPASELSIGALDVAGAVNEDLRAVLAKSSAIPRSSWCSQPAAARVGLPEQRARREAPCAASELTSAASNDRHDRTPTMVPATCRSTREGGAAGTKATASLGGSEARLRGHRAGRNGSASRRACGSGQCSRTMVRRSAG